MCRKSFVKYIGRVMFLFLFVFLCNVQFYWSCFQTYGIEDQKQSQVLWHTQQNHDNQLCFRPLFVNVLQNMMVVQTDVEEDNDDDNHTDFWLDAVKIIFGADMHIHRQLVFIKSAIITIYKLPLYLLYMQFKADLSLFA